MKRTPEEKELAKRRREEARLREQPFRDAVREYAETLPYWLMSEIIEREKERWRKKTHLAFVWPVRVERPPRCRPGVHRAAEE